MRFVAALLGLRAQDMKTGAPAHLYLRYATVETSHTPGTLYEKACLSFRKEPRVRARLLRRKIIIFRLRIF